jgi:hypothetical protein
LAVLLGIARFVGGVVVGSVLAGMLAILLIVAVFARNHLLLTPDTRIRVAGADVSAAGGRQTYIEQERRRLRQDCRGTCDDLFLRGGYDVRIVRIVDAKGRCIVCRKRLVWELGLNDWRVEASPKLAARGVRR